MDQHSAQIPFGIHDILKPKQCEQNEVLNDHLTKLRQIPKKGEHYELTKDHLRRSPLSENGLDKMRKNITGEHPRTIITENVAGTFRTDDNLSQSSRTLCCDGNDDVSDDEELNNNIPNETNRETEDDIVNNNKKKKSRTVFSRRQVYRLESMFDSKRYLSSSERASLAESLDLSETQVSFSRF